MGTKLKVEAIVREHFFGITYTSFAYTTVVESSVVLHFLGPENKAFKPGMPFRVYVSRNAVVYLECGGGGRGPPNHHPALIKI